MVQRTWSGAGWRLAHEPSADPDSGEQPCRSTITLLPLFVVSKRPAIAVARGSGTRMSGRRTRPATVRVRPLTVAHARTHIAPSPLLSHVQGGPAVHGAASR